MQRLPLSARPAGELFEDERRAVGHQDYQVVARGAGDRLPCRLDLVEDDVDLAIAATAGRDRACEQIGDLAAAATAWVVVLADDDLVEGARSQAAEGVDVVVAPVAR